LNVLALVGKQLMIEEATINPVTLKLRLSAFSLISDKQWDCQVPPNLQPIKTNEVIQALQHFFFYKRAQLAFQSAALTNAQEEHKQSQPLSQPQAPPNQIMHVLRQVGVPD
jgi:hypothetical protein